MKKAIVGLLGAATLCGCGGSGSNTPYTYTDASSYSEYKEPTVFSTPVTDLDIDWPVGQVIVQKGESVRVEESASKGEYLPLYHFLDSGKLKLRYCKDGSIYHDLQKKLVVTIPGDLGAVDISTISGSYSVDLGSVKTMKGGSTSGKGEVTLTSLESGEFTGISGAINGKIGNAGSLTITTSSGSSKFEIGTLRTYRRDSISGSTSLTVKDTASLSKVEIETTSGTGDLYFDGKKGIDLEFKTTTGKQELEFTKGSDPSLGKITLKYSSISGSVNVHKIG